MTRSSFEEACRELAARAYDLGDEEYHRACDTLTERCLRDNGFGSGVEILMGTGLQRWYS